jgi:hypothetical protein
MGQPKAPRGPGRREEVPTLQPERGKSLNAVPAAKPQVRQWHRWEEEAPASEVFLHISGAAQTPRQIPGSWARPQRALRRARANAKALWERVGTSGFMHGVRIALAVVTTDLLFSPVTRTVYYCLRLTFIERLQLDRSFDFASFVER